MAITSKWRQHIEAWQRSGLSQAEYCAEQQINVRTFTARLSDTVIYKLDFAIGSTCILTPNALQTLLIVSKRGFALGFKAL